MIRRAAFTIPKKRPSSLAIIADDSCAPCATWNGAATISVRPVWKPGRKKARSLTLSVIGCSMMATALRLALFPLITVWFTLVTAPIALYLAIRHWNSPMSIVRPDQDPFHPGNGAFRPSDPCMGRIDCLFSFTVMNSNMDGRRQPDTSDFRGEAPAEKALLSVSSPGASSTLATTISFPWKIMASPRITNASTSPISRRS